MQEFMNIEMIKGRGKRQLNIFLYFFIFKVAHIRLYFAINMPMYMYIFCHFHTVSSSLYSIYFLILNYQKNMLTNEKYDFPVLILINSINMCEITW